MSNYTRSLIKKKINRELPIVVLYNHLVLNKLIHPKAIKNEHILNGDIPLEPIDLQEIDFEKDKAIPTPCFFHNTMNSDSTNFVLPKEEVIGPNGKPKPSNFYRCFACQSGKHLLNPIKFNMVMRHGIRPEHVDIFEGDNIKAYYKSIEELSALMGIKYDDEKREISNEEHRKIRINLILKRAADIYHQFLKSKDSFAKRAQAYLFRERGFSAIGNAFYKIIDELKLGCAPNKFNSTFLYDQLKAEGFTDDELLESKVVKRLDNGKIIDFHKNGIILPYTYGGRIHNLYCRQFTDKKKYRHMKLGQGIEFPVNFDKAKKFPFLIMVEGEIDFITWKALGFENVISVGGTNGFSDDHLHQILYEFEKSNGENCRTVYVCLDGDGAGNDAVYTVAGKLLAAGIDVRVIRMKTIDENGNSFSDDPNKFFQTFGLKTKSIFDQLIKEALSFSGFKFIMKVENDFAMKEKEINGTELLGFVRRNRQLLNEVPHEERLFLALEIADYFKIERQWLLDAWSISKKPQSKDYKPFHEKIFERKWVMLFQDREMAKVCFEFLENVVCYETPEEFIKASKDHTGLNTIVLHASLPNEYKDVIFQALPHFQFQYFIGEKPEEVAKVENYHFRALIRKASNPYVNAAS